MLLSKPHRLGIGKVDMYRFGESRTGVRASCKPGVNRELERKR